MNDYVLEMNHITKKYGETTVLHDVSLRVKPGEILALIGENGAGKSTIMNILFGMPVIRMTGGFEGEIRFEGNPVNISSPIEASRLGIGMVHQEFMLIDNFTVAENVRLNREEGKSTIISRILGREQELIDRKGTEDASRPTLDSLGVSLDATTRIKQLPVGYKQFVEIARELDKSNIKLLVLDEPTAVLSEKEAEIFLNCVQGVAKRGVAVIFISHRLEEIKRASDRLYILKDGELVGEYTAILPTTLSSTEDELFENLTLIDEASAITEDMPEILGTHLEGPYFSPEQNAAQDARYIKYPTPEEYEHIYEHCPSIRIWSVAPELPGAMEMGRWMRDHGIIGSIGHTNATYDEVMEARENGYTMITHFFNGMSRLVRKEAKMYLGVAESGLCFDDLTAEIIADGCHLPPCLLKLIYKVKGPDHLCLVTDSMRAAGLNVEESILGSRKNGQRVIIEGGVAYMPGKTSFGGSIATADRLVRTMNKQADVPLADAVKMMTVTPARMLGVEGRIGSIVKGADADLLIFDDNIQIHDIMIKGKTYNRHG